MTWHLLSDEEKALLRREGEGEDIWKFAVRVVHERDDARATAASWERLHAEEMAARSQAQAACDRLQQPLAEAWRVARQLSDECALYEGMFSDAARPVSYVLRERYPQLREKLAPDD